MEGGAGKLLQDFSGHCRSLDKKSTLEVARLAEAMKAMLQRKATRAIKEQKTAGLLCSYVSDGTPLKYFQQVQAGTDAVKAKRSGVNHKEFLVEQATLRYFDDEGEAPTTVVLADPMPLTLGKTMPALLAAWESFMETPRQQGHRGLCVMHFSFDRANLVPLSNLIRRRLIQEAPNHGAGEQGVRPVILNWLEWVVFTPCSLHDLQNSLR